jgi:signal transduction histidine kinase
MEFEDPVPECNGPHTYFSVKFPIYDAEETLQGIGGISTDITERKRTEAERETLVEELENKNAELERFTYTVSHDLNSPLITIRGLVGMLRQDLEKTRHDQIRHGLDHIDDAAKHMQGL